MKRGRMEASGTNRTKDSDLENRRSPRTCVRKIKKGTFTEEMEVQNKHKNRRKRKAEIYEDDPNYSEEEGVDERIGQRKKVPGYRCSSHLVPELMDKLSGKQKGWVKNIGFDALQGFIGSRCPKSLTMWLVDQVDTKTGTLSVCGVPVDIRKSVKRILNLPCGDRQVPQALNGRSKAKVAKVGTAQHDDKHSHHGRGQTAKDLQKVLLAENEDENSFCRSFVMLVLCIYLAPTTSLNINRNYYPALMDVSHIKSMDWCGFVADYLLRGIDEFRCRKASHVQVPGCVHLLPLIYIDALIMHKALVLPEAIALPEGEPRSHFIQTCHFSFLASADLNTKAKDRVQYGLLQAKLTASKGWAEGKRHVQQEETNGASGVKDGDQCERGSTAVSDGDVDEMLEYVFKQVIDLREKLVDEFKKRMIDVEAVTFQLFREKFLRILKNPEHKGSMPKGRATCENCCGKAHFVGASSVDGQRSGESVKQGVSRACPIQGNTSVGDVIRDTVCNELAGASEKFASEENSEPLGETEQEMDENYVSDGNVAANDAAKKFELVHRNGNSMKDAEQGLEVDKVDVHKNYDELEDAVQIGKDAVQESCLNHKQMESKTRCQIKVSILSEAAASEYHPLFDGSPAQQAPSACIVSDPENAGRVARGNIQHLEEGCPIKEVAELKQPVYDVSPVAHSHMARMQKERVDSLLYMSTTGGQIREAYSGISTGSLILPGDYINPTANDVGPTEVDPNEKSAFPKDIPITGNEEDELTGESEESESYESKGTTSEEGYKSSDIPSARDEDEGYGKNPLEVTPGFICTPSCTYDTQETIDVDEIKASPTPDDITHIAPLKKELEFGTRFKYGCTVSGDSAKLLDSMNENGTGETGIDEIVKFKFVLSNHASDTYKSHVSNSSARIQNRYKNVVQFNRDRTKIRIKNVHVTKGEFVDALKPNGEVSQSLMGLCSVAIMADWETNKRFILDQATIKELMKEGHVCDQKSIAKKVQKLDLEELEEIFLPMLTGNHWILGVVNVVEESVQLFDSLLPVSEGEHPHQKLWKQVGENLERAYCLARRRSIAISFFEWSYPKIKMQTNTHDCGFHVIQALECYRTKDIVGYGKKKNLLTYRKYLCHVLVYHRFNDLNPLRPNLPYEEP